MFFIGYFQNLFKILYTKTPTLYDRTTEVASPLATSILSLIVHPLYLIALGKQSSHKHTEYLSDMLGGAVPPWCKWEDGGTGKRDETGATLASAKRVESKEEVMEYPTYQQKQIKGKQSQSEGILLPSCETLRSQGNTHIETSSDTHVPMELDTTSFVVTSEEKVKDSQRPSKSLRMSSNEGVEDQDVVILDISTTDVSRSGQCTDNSLQMPAYAISSSSISVFSDIPDTFINSTLYNLLSSLYNNAKFSQIYNYLVPCLEHSRLLQCHSSVTDRMLQAMDMLATCSGNIDISNRDSTLAYPSSGSGSSSSWNSKTLNAKDLEQQQLSSGDLQNSQKVDVDAPTKLSFILMLIPIKTNLTTTSLHLYLQCVRRFVQLTVYHLPHSMALRQLSSVTSSTTVGGGGGYEPMEDEEEEEPETDEDSDDDMDGSYTSNTTFKPPERFLQVWEWSTATVSTCVRLSITLEL